MVKDLKILALQDGLSQILSSKGLPEYPGPFSVSLHARILRPKFLLDNL